MSRVSELQDAIVTLFGETSGFTPGNLGSMDLKTLQHAFKRIAFDCHPDRAVSLGGKHESLKSEFLSVQKAYQTLAKEIRAQRKDSPTRRASKEPSPSCRARQVPNRKLRLGEFLMHTLRITRGDFTRAMDWQMSSRPKVGEIAARQGFISRDQILDILQDRNRLGKRQTPFAQFAVNHGYIDGLAKLAILGRQRKLQKPIGSFFLENKLMHKEELNRALIELKVHNAGFAV